MDRKQPIRRIGEIREPVGPVAKHHVERDNPVEFPGWAIHLLDLAGYKAHNERNDVARCAG
jgi:hypothetical protein